MGKAVHHTNMVLEGSGFAGLGFSTEDSVGRVVDFGVIQGG
jgi:hypothetical protein